MAKHTHTFQLDFLGEAACTICGLLESEVITVREACDLDGFMMEELIPNALQSPYNKASR